LTRRRLHAACKSSMRTNAAHRLQRTSEHAVGNDRRQTRSWPASLATPRATGSYRRPIPIILLDADRLARLQIPDVWRSHAGARSGGFAPNGFRSGARVVSDVRSAHASGPMSTWSKSPRQTYKSRLGPEAIGGTIRTCAGPAADAPIGRRLTPYRRYATSSLSCKHRAGRVPASRRICSVCRSAPAGFSFKIMNLIHTT